MKCPKPPPVATPAAESIYRSLFGAYPDGLLLVDHRGSILMANPEAERLLGYDSGELSGLTVDVLVPDAIRPRHAAYREAYSHEPKARPMGTQMELVAKRRDGREVMVEIALSPLEIEGHPFVVAAIRGIEAYPRVKQALQRARYSEFVAQMGRLAVDTRDPQLLLQQVPAVAADALQVDAAVVFLLETSRLEFHVAGGVGLLAGEGLGSRLPNRPDTPPGFILAHGRPVTVADYRTERRFKVPPAYLLQGLVSALAVPLVDRGQIIGVLSVRSRQPERFGADELHFLESLSNLLAASLQRSQSEEALNHAQRMESVGQLTGGIAHDFNNLLTVIQGNLQVLEEHPALEADAGAQQMVAAAARASRRGAELTGKLLAFSRRQQLSPTEVDVGELIESLADMLRRTLDQRIRIDVTTDARGLRCEVDAGQLESALLNIAINSRDAMPEGGTLSFTCAPCVTFPPDVAAELGERARHGAFVEIAITDTGEGMTESVRERVFEPFFTTKELGRGTGLGMSTVYGFVKQSRGSIRLNTAPGAGTEVTLYLPQVRGTAEPEDPTVDLAEGVPPGLQVMLVEDDADVRCVVEQFLLSLGCRISAFDRAEPALASLDAGERCQLVLTDIALGAGMRGTELARQIQSRWPAVAVLLMSGYSSELLQAPGGDDAPWELLRKPYERSDLARAIVQALKSRRSASAGS
ncbi:MAG: PAS domain S-box protein [Burkholderiaceae bacterium]|nr:PAS domain S-box protein [Burkholderiaceae bacterium]